VRKRYVWTIRFEKVLIDMESRTKGFERCFEPFNPIILGCNRFCL
jgi:hypothetical protein